MCRKLELGIVGRGRERDLGDPNQMAMSVIGLLAGEETPPAPVATEKVREHERAKPTGLSTRILFAGHFAISPQDV